MKRAAALTVLGAVVFVAGMACGAVGIAVVAALQMRSENVRDLGPRRSRSGHRRHPRHMPWPRPDRFPAAPSGVERY